MGELYNADNKPINLCSFYHPPDNNVHSVTQPSESLYKLYSNHQMQDTTN